MNGIGLFSFLLHCVLAIKIQCYKRRFKISSIQPAIPCLTNSAGKLAILEKQSLSGVLSNSFFLLQVSMSIIFLFHINSMDPIKTRLFPNNVIIYFYYCVYFHFTVLSVLCLYYFNNKDLRKRMWREAKEICIR